MNKDERYMMNEKELDHLAREIGRPVPAGFTEHVLARVREREQQRQLEWEQTRPKERSRGKEREL